MGYNVHTASKDYGPRKGLDGPFIYPNGQVCYYDPVEGAYWDPKTDWFLTQEEANRLQDMVVDRLRGVKV